ncbi:MAG: Adenylate cyclase [Bacteroidetes bacterium]|nr:Adenylate cyclase [Bacteroidota bacterium]
MIGSTISHYRILEKLGEGGMGVVYKAHDTKLNRDVALKFLPPNLLVSEDDRHRFVHEAQASAALSHPNIATVFEIDESEAKTFIALEFIEGQSLAQKIKSGPLKVDDALSIVIQTCEGLQAAHEKGIVHRDIKSQNIMVTTKGQLKILDFGLAKLRGATVLTKAGTTIGTMGYMSPEQLRGEAVDHRTDIWAVGVVLYEMIAGRRPFQGDYEDAVAYQVINQQPEPLTAIRTGVPMELERIVKKAMQKERANRYQHVVEIVTDLRSLKEEIETGLEKGAVTKTRLPVKKRLYAYLLLGVLVLIVTAVMILTQFPPTKEKIESLAVLPLENIGQDPDQEYFADGVTEALITYLSKISALRVISRTSAMQYKGVKKPLPQIARELNVDALIEGSVLREGTQVRITVRLIQGSTDEHLWAESYQRELRGVLVLQSEMAQVIARQIGMRVSPEERARLTNARPVNPKAQELYLKGRFYWNMRTQDGIRKGTEYFQQAIEEDPGYPLAYAGIADCYALLGSPGLVALPPREAFPKATAAAMKALEGDSTLGEAHTSLAFVKLVYDWAWSDAQKGFHRAIELNPGYATAHHWFGLIYFVAMGQFDEALAEMKRAAELDPLSLVINTDVGRTLYFARQYDQAIEQLRKTLKMDPEFFRAHWNLGLVYEQKGMFEEAIAAFQRAKAFSSDNLLATGALGHAYAISGRRDEALKVIEELRKESRKKYVPAYQFAAIYAGLKDNDRAFAWLERAYEERSPTLTWLQVDPVLDSLRPDPRFTALLKKVGFLL